MSTGKIDKILNHLGTMFNNLAFYLKSGTMDLSKSDNNVSVTTYPSYSFLDKEKRIMGRFEAVVEPGGRNGVQMYARNYDTNGNQVAQYGLKLAIDKSGTGTWFATPTWFISREVACGTYSIAANGNLNVNMNSYITARCPSGYTPVGILGFSTNHGSAVGVYSVRLGNSSYAFEVKNITSSAISNVKPVVRVLYGQSNLVTVEYGTS